MKNEIIYSNIEKKPSKFSKLYLKDNDQERPNNSINSILTDKENKNFHNKNSSFYKIESPKKIKKSIISNISTKKYSSSNSKINFMSLFGKNASRNTNLMNISNNIINNSINNSVISSNNSDQEKKNLKVVEKELKNKLKDMTVIMINKSFVMDNKLRKKLGISLVEEVNNHKKRRRKKKKLKKGDERDRKIMKKKAIFDSLDEDENQWDDDDYIFINVLFIFS